MGEIFSSLAKQKIVVLTGAGVSAESGLQTFRDAGGLWEGYNVYEVATPEAFAKNPAMVLEFYNMRRKNITGVKPNDAHLALVKLEEKYEVNIITQNIDDLHERAGSANVLHLHGEIFKSRSSGDESLIYECKNDLNMGDKCEKDFQLRPHIVWFGEQVPMIEPASILCHDADILIVVGTSLVVYPAAGLINYAKFETPKYLVDPKKPEVFHIGNLKFIIENASTGVPKLVKQLIESNG